MNDIPRLSWFKTVLRLWTLRRVGGLPSGTPTRAILFLSALCLSLWLVIDWWQRQPDPELSSDGIPLLGWYGLAVLALGGLLRWRSSIKPDFGAALVLATALAPLPLLLMTVMTRSDPWFWTVCSASGIYGLLYLARGLRAFTGRSQRPAAIMGVLFVTAFVVVSDRTNAIPDVWNPRDTQLAASDQDVGERESALFEQSARIDQGLESVLRDRSPGPQAFFLGFAGVGDQKVFAQEIGLASRVIGERYGTGGRQLSLVNDERNLNDGPLASVSGLDYALQGLATRMKLDRDVLILAISSHGSEDPSIAVSNSQFPLSDLTPQDLADTLADAGIEWRVLLISACYAGGFIEPLRDAHTIVITAAAADRTSFGCSSDSDLTYFGEAFYRDALPAAMSLRDAVDKAKAAIAVRERAEGEEASNPQAFFGFDLEAHLAGAATAAAPGKAGHGNLAGAAK